MNPPDHADDAAKEDCNRLMPNSTKCWRGTDLGLEKLKSHMTAFGEHDLPS